MSLTIVNSEVNLDWTFQGGSAALVWAAVLVGVASSVWGAAADPVVVGSVWRAAAAVVVGSVPLPLVF